MARLRARRTVSENPIHEVNRAEAADCLHALIEKVVVIPGEKRGETTVELHGHIPAILTFAAGSKRLEPRSV